MLIQTAQHQTRGALPRNSTHPTTESVGDKSAKCTPTVLHRLQSSSATLSFASLCRASDSLTLPTHPTAATLSLAENTHFMQSLREAHPATPEFVRCQTAAATSASKKVTFELSPSSLNIASLPPKVAVIADKTCQPVGIDETKRQRRNSDEANKVRSCELVETWLRSGTISSMKYYPPETRQKLPAAPGSSNVTINGSIKNEYSNMMDNTVPRSPHSICPDSPVCVSHGATASILRQEAFADTESGASDDEEFSQLQRVLEISLKEARERAGLGTGQVFYTVEDKVVPNASDNDDDEYYDDEDTDLDDEYAWNAADDYDEDEALAKAIEVSRRDFEEKDCKLARCE